MSRFFSDKFSVLTPYTPGEQPRDRKYIKLNTNENPYPPSPKSTEYAKKASETVELYSDPTCLKLLETAAKTFGVDKDEVVAVNGSDEILNFAMAAFCDSGTPAVFADITYGFYPVFAQYNGVPYREIPLKDDFTIDIKDYFNAKGTIFIANPNAPTGILLKIGEIEEIIKNNPDNIVIIDEAYIDFGGESAVGLIKKYDNLLVTQTFSKSRSMAGARLGLGFASKALIRDINTIRYSTNPYNVNSMTLAAGTGALEDAEYTKKCCDAIIETREQTKAALRKMNFTMTDSSSNFLFAKHPEIGGEELYLKLKERGILVRHFTKERIKDYNRITVGTKEQMDALIKNIREILEERK